MMQFRDVRALGATLLTAALPALTGCSGNDPFHENGPNPLLQGWRHVEKGRYFEVPVTGDLARYKQNFQSSHPNLTIVSEVALKHSGGPYPSTILIYAEPNGKSVYGDHGIPDI